ncbi:zinc-dependent alcohol dehydrogenase family protein [Pseudoflavonifractor phocaeensis]|uniref:zinc-dependent alcohol dehydrogenase family protein n=1 Tax=Pseudoflavonifractor phocaeensis TaxID=1870988 RepID=UPI001F24AF7C|nr:zinc-dependent alcohol dehydrogenase family protein [Pseudoflavonifractor phocaeensis]MCF2662436.1 zinc-dependent alcohol dehydrogenase family protein [Pseudoflavonifractor phocaeensis]
MKGTFFLGNQTFETRALPEHDLAADEVLVRVAACGVCGTDVHIYHGDKGSADVQPPVILGHEFSGVVEKTGAGVTKVAVGDHVTVDPNIYCGECHYCRMGKKQLCAALRAIGVNRNGGFAEYCYVPQSQCYQLSKEVPLAHGAMAEPLACCIHGIDRAQIRPGSTVCVIGGGAIGLLMVQLARLSGASRVILSEPVPLRREIGLQVGADHVIDPVNEPLKERLAQLLGVDGADVVIECVGNTAATAQAFQVAKRGTTVLLFSVPKAGTTHPLSLEDVYQKELTIVGSMINPDTHLRAVELINSGRIQLAPLITHHYPVEQVKEAILMQMSSQSIKVMVGNG